MADETTGAGVAADNSSDSDSDDELHPLFRKELDPERDAEFIGAMKELQAEAGPENMAKECKQKGNTLFKGGPAHYDDARIMYTKALEHIASAGPAPELKELEASVRSNRAAVNMHKGNYRKVIEDCQEAMLCHAATIKPYWRAAKASVSLNDLREAAQYCEMGLKQDPENEPIKKVARQVKALVQKAKERAEKEAQRRAAAAALEAKRREELRLVLLERGVSLGPAQYNAGAERGEERRAPVVLPKLSEDGLLQWPALFLYGEHAQSDSIEQFPESTCLRDHLEEMFPPQGARPAWDTTGSYTLEQMEAFIQLEGVTPMDLTQGWPAAADDDTRHEAKADGKWLFVPLDMYLGDLMGCPGYVVPGFPVFHVMAKGTKFHTQFIQQHNPSVLGFGD